MAKNISKLLESIGLMPSEAGVYLTALRLGSDTVQNIAKGAGISRTAAYDAIVGLQKKGLLTSSVVGKKRLYAAEEPGRLEQIVKEQQDALERKAEELMGSMDALRMLAGGSKPVVRVYEGKEAIHAFFDFVERAEPEEFLEIVNVDELYRAVDEGVLLTARKTYKWTAKKNRGLHVGELRNPRAGWKYKKLKKKWGDFKGDIAIFGNYLALVTYEDGPLCVIIESPVFSSAMRVLFEAAWEGAE